MAGAVRQPVDIASLSTYLRENVPSVKLPIQIKQFGFGQSNPTYAIAAANGEQYVLRKKPPGKLLSTTAHQVEREYRILRALEKTDVPVPKTYCLCEDTSVLATPFYIMEFLDGRIFQDASFPSVPEDERHEMWYDAIQTLAKLHRLSPESVGLLDYGKRSGFYNRQLKTFGALAESQSKSVDIETKDVVGMIPHFDEMTTFFRDPETQPMDRATLIHGDYKIDNLVYHMTEPRVVGILDWEMSTLGHPLSDLSNLLSPFTFARQPPTDALASHINPAFLHSGGILGLPSRSQCIEWYAKVAGWDPRSESDWGDAFGVFRNSVIMQGIAARYAMRQASSARAEEYAVQMEPFGEFAWSLVSRLKQQRDKRKSKL